MSSEIATETTTTAVRRIAFVVVARDRKLGPSVRKALEGQASAMDAELISLSETKLAIVASQVDSVSRAPDSTWVRIRAVLSATDLLIVRHLKAAPGSTADAFEARAFSGGPEPRVDTIRLPRDASLVRNLATFALVHLGLLPASALLRSAEAPRAEDVPSVEDDVVTLRSGDQLAGRVAEEKPGKYVSVVTADGRRHTLAWADVRRVSRAPGSQAPPPTADAQSIGVPTSRKTNYAKIPSGQCKEPTGRRL